MAVWSRGDGFGENDLLRNDDGSSSVIVVIAFGFYMRKLNGILAFWIAYILTRPMGASFGDFLSQPLAKGGLGFGTIVTSILFLGCIAAIIVAMTFRQRRRETAKVIMP